jgi:hypothetical protein
MFRYEYLTKRGSYFDLIFIYKSFTFLIIYPKEEHFLDCRLKNQFKTGTNRKCWQLEATKVLKIIRKCNFFSLLHLSRKSKNRNKCKKRKIPRKVNKFYVFFYLHPNVLYKNRFFKPNPSDTYNW